MSLPPSARLTAVTESVDANSNTIRVSTVTDAASVWTITETPGTAPSL
jgi:hypothetical protein